MTPERVGADGTLGAIAVADLPGKAGARRLDKAAIDWKVVPMRIGPQLLERGLARLQQDGEQILG